MIDAPVTTMDHQYRAQRASKSRYRTMKESPNAKCDLIFDSYIDPTTVRHMTIPIVKRHDATQEAMRLLVCDTGAGIGSTTTNMEGGTSSAEKKRFRLTPPGTSRTGCGGGGLSSSSSSSSRMDTERHRHPQQTLPCDPTISTPDDQAAAVDDNDASTYTSKRVKHNNDLLREVSSKEEEWNFVPYPNHKDIDHALNHQCQGISQLLLSWDQVLCSDPYDYDIHQQTNDLGTGCVVDVEHALLDFHVTSDDWNGNHRVLSTTTADSKQHRDRRQEHSKYHKVLPSDSSSVSSISFLEQHAQVPIPTLLRVTTSRILEEQELIWEQIKQEHHDPDPVQHCDINSLWHHEVTRGHHILHPPMSPQGRRHTGNLFQESLAANETDIEGSVADGSVGFKTPTSGKRQNFSSNMQSLPSLGPLFPMNFPVRPAQVTPSKTDRPSRFAPCLGCQAHVPFPQPVSSAVASSVVHCIYCGMMASADLMQRSFMEVVDE